MKLIISEQEVHNYYSLMMNIAYKQRELLDCKFYWKERIRQVEKKNKLFFFKDNNTIYRKLLNELEELKQKAIECLKRGGKGTGFFWWNIPWSEVEKYLILDLAEEAVIPELENWRFEKAYKLSVEKEYYQKLLLVEEGHYSNFSKKSYRYTNRISSYNNTEIRDRMKNSKKILDQLDDELYYRTQMEAPNAIVKSENTGEIYISIEDYLYSYEHTVRKDRVLRDYERTLYKDVKTTETYVESNSNHYQCIYEIGKFNLKDGIVDDISADTYKVYFTKQNIPECVLNIYNKRNPIIALAAFLSDYSAVRCISNGILDKDIMGCRKDIDDALCDSEFFTCICKKLEL